MGEKPETEECRSKEPSNLRWLFFFLGVFLTASVGLAIALGVVAAKDDDNDTATPVVVVATGRPLSGTERPGRPSRITVRPTAMTARPDSETSPGPCTDASCVLRAGELLASMDTTVDPCQDFYQYSCGNWLKTHSIPESESIFGRFEELRDNVRLELKGLLEQPYDSNTESSSIRKAKMMYQSCLNETQLNELGVKPLKDLVQQLGTWPLMSGSSGNQPFDLESVLLKIAEYQMSPLIDVGVFPDNENSSMYIIWIDQATFGMDRNYLVKGRNSTQVTTYEELLRQLAVHVLGVNSSDSLTRDIGNVVELEVELAKISASRAERRNAEKFYKKTTISELQQSVPKFRWLKYLTDYFRPVNITVTGDTQIGQFSEDYLNKMLDLYNKTDKRIVANYLLMRIVHSYASYLTREIRDLSGPLRQVLYGVTQTGARWKTCVDKLNSVFAQTAVGQLYVKTYFTAAAKRKAVEMIGYIRESIKQMMSDVTWMDAATKARASEKADAIIEKIGYPDYQFNETVLEQIYKDVDYKANAYFQNAIDFARSVVRENALRLNKVPSRKDWSDSASTVNAFYSDSHNTITFPAGILQPPFYAEDFPMSMIFGGIGMVIGHEMTHGFDDQGRKYDKEGNNVPWWSESSVSRYQDLAKCYVDQYSKNVVSGLHVNGNLTLGENIADNGGIKAAFLAYQKWQSNNEEESPLPGLELTHPQLFFVNFAQGWCSLVLEEEARDRILTDPHSPDHVRVRVTLRNSQFFADAFNCPVGSDMNPENKCHLW